MGVIVVTGPEDPVFSAELRALDRSDDWKMWAISGRMSAGLEAMFEGDQRGGRGHPMHRGYVGPAEDRRAWLWGYHWKEGGPPPVERPEGACPECWRLGEACREHYRGLYPDDLVDLALQRLDTILVSGVLRVQLDGSYVPVDMIPFERLQTMVLGHECAEHCEFPGCYVIGCVRKSGAP